MNRTFKAPRWSRSDYFLKNTDTATDVLLLDHIEVPIVQALARTSVTPTQVTLLSLFVRAAACVGFATDSLALGAALYLAGLILDGVDGKLARRIHRLSARGGTMDITGDFALFVALWFTLGLNQGVNDWILIIGAALAVASALATQGASAAEVVAPQAQSKGRRVYLPGVLETHVLLFGIVPLIDAAASSALFVLCGTYYGASWVAKLIRLGGRT